jgi:D-alanyl-D-alanine carboxypeptidase
MRVAALALVTFLLTACGSSSRTTVGGPCSPKPASAPRVARELRALVKDYGLPGAVAAVCTPAGTAHAAAGFSDLREQTRMRPTDRFRIASVTKTFVATVVLQLAGEGKLTLRDSVEHWLPGVVPRGREITVRELLNHTSGVSEYFADPRVLKTIERNPRVVVPVRTLVARAVSHPLDFTPGHDFGYSNTNYFLLGLIVEKASRRSLEHELESRIVEPLGLGDTTFMGRRARRLPNEMRGYDIEAGGTRSRDATLATLGGAWAAGGIVSSTDDLTRFFSALLGGELLRPQELRAMKTVAFTAADDGLGLFRFHDSCRTSWGHGGSLPGYQTFVRASADGTRVVVVATNSSSRAGAGALGELAADAFCRR